MFPKCVSNSPAPERTANQSRLVRAGSLVALGIGAFLIAAALERHSGVAASCSELVSAALFLPVTSVVGNRAALGLSAAPALVLGSVFWPVWGWLAVRWIRRGPGFVSAVTLVLWTLVGFAQPLTRLGLIMSA